MNPQRLGLVISRFNQPITDALYEGACQQWRESFGLEEHDSPLAVWVPGAVEIPVMAQHLFRQHAIDAVVALGAVIQGETQHYEVVCQQVGYGCQRVALTTGKPVIFGVLTTPNAELAWDRVGGKKGHAGREAILSAIEMMKNMSCS